MTHWRKIVSKDAKHLNVWDIEGASPVTVTIERTASEVVHGEDGEEKTMLFVYFKGGKKGLGLSVTNAILIEAQHGAEIEGWIGKQVTLRTATCRGEDCVRLDAPRGFRFPKRIPKFTYTDKPKEG